MKDNIKKLTLLFDHLEQTKNVGLFKKNINQFLAGNQPILEEALIGAANGDNRKLNKWFFELPSDHLDLVPWLGKVKTSTGEKYAWLIGQIDGENQAIVRKTLNKAWIRIQNDPIFHNPQERPPFIIYLKNIISSNWQNEQFIPNELEGVPQFGRVGMFVESTALPHNKPLTPSHHRGEILSSDIEIFQDNFSESENTDDIDWKMPLDSDFLMIKTNLLFERLKANCTQETIDFYEENVLKNAEIITKLHTEIHNFGHFLGPFVFTQSTKNEPAYEALEEFRACLMTGAIADSLDLNESITHGLPVHVFFMRFLVYGFDSFLKGKFDVVNTREMEVGALFYYLLGSKGVIVNRNDKIHLKSELVKDVFRAEVEHIHQLELGAMKRKTGLTQIANSYKNALYNNGRYTISDFYKKLKN